MSGRDSSEYTEFVKSKGVFLGTYCGPCENNGVQGGTGATGVDGRPGATGPSGLDGTNGNTILNGSIPPTNLVGNVGDFYLNTTTSILYGPKSPLYSYTGVDGALYYGIFTDSYGLSKLSSYPSFIAGKQVVTLYIYIQGTGSTTIVFGAKDTASGSPTLTVTNKSNNNSTDINFGSNYMLSNGTTYVLVYTCSPGRTLSQISFSDNNGGSATVNADTWSLSVSLKGVTGATGVGSTGATGVTGSVGATGPQGLPGIGNLGFIVNSVDPNQRDLVIYYDTDGPKTIRNWLSYLNPATQQYIFALQLATFNATASVSILPATTVNWDVTCTGFTVNVVNPVDYTSEYISSVYGITATGGNVSTVLTDYSAGSKSRTPAGGVSWNQTFNTNGNAYIRPPNSETSYGGSASGIIRFNRVVGTSPESPYTLSAGFAITWNNVTNGIGISQPSGQTFLTTYGSTSYSPYVGGVTNPATYSHTVTPTGGTIDNPSGSGTFTFTTAIHKDNLGITRTLALRTKFTRPSNVMGKSYDVYLDAGASATATFTYPSFYYFTIGVTTVPVTTDIISGTDFATGVTVLADQQRSIPLSEITNTSTSPRAFWFGLRSTLVQPTVFQVGDGKTMADVPVTNGGVIRLQPTPLPPGYTSESYALYGITLQPGKSYVKIE